MTASDTPWLFASDLHGRMDRYDKLFDAVAEVRPRALLLGGDLLPSGAMELTSARGAAGDFVRDVLEVRLSALRSALGTAYPRVLIILGNDDPRSEEPVLKEIAGAGLWEYIHGRRTEVDGVPIYGYSHVPPTPFQLKDWERYDVSRFVDPGCVSPEEGYRTVPISKRDARWRTIREDLEQLTGDHDLTRAVMLFHSPPYRTALDRAALDGEVVDHTPLDVHVGSIAIQRFIKRRRPAVTLHGHVHESARITGRWLDELKDTTAMTAAHDGPELALVQFDPANPGDAVRRLL